MQRRRGSGPPTRDTDRASTSSASEAARSGVSALMTIISIASGASGRFVRVVIAEFVIWAIVTKRELFAKRSGRRC